MLAATPAAAQTQPEPDAPIISDEEFDAKIPPLESIEEWQKREDGKDAADALSQRPAIDPESEMPLEPIAQFDAIPLVEPANAEVRTLGSVRYRSRIDGLQEGDVRPVAKVIQARFDALSVLKQGNMKVDNPAVVAARMADDKEVLQKILESEGFFDAKVDGAIEPASADGGPISAVLSAAPGRRYNLGQIAIVSPPAQPADLLTQNFLPKSGDPIVADTILSAEANLAVILPQNGYPFAAIGERDILLNEDSALGDYTLPVSLGARSYFGDIKTTGDAVFDAQHIALLQRFKKGQLYDASKLEDLRLALAATGLLSTYGIETKPSGESATDGTAYANLWVTQAAGPARTIAASAGYGTGQGIRVEGSWTHRNLFPPEGAFIASAVAGTQEQEIAASFRRSNAGRRDRSVELGLSAQHSNFEAFNAYTGRLAGRISYNSTPIWRKKWTYAFGFEAIATSERDFNIATSTRDRRIFYLAALPLQIGYDRSNDLLDPSSGFRLNAEISPEASIGAETQLYGRAMLEGKGYIPLGDSIVFAARARAGSIIGAKRENIAPSRRYYGGGGGSVRGFGYQQLGPKDINFDPIGGRSLNEAAIEARYRFGDYGVVGFADAGQVYEKALPKFNDWRFGVGLGARLYTNFGPLRLDVATPIKRQTGESHVSVYVSIGQAF